MAMSSVFLPFHDSMMVWTHPKSKTQALNLLWAASDDGERGDFWRKAEAEAEAELFTTFL